MRVWETEVGEANAAHTTQEKGPKPLGEVWLRCSWPVVTAGLVRILEKNARVHCGGVPPDRGLDFVIVCVDSAVDDLPEMVDRLRDSHPGVSIIAFGLRLDLSVAQAALQSGAQGFMHAGMRPEQVIRALQVASEGELVAPRQLLEFLIEGGDSANLAALSARQQEILELVANGSSNAQIARRLYLSESTVKQHLRAAYKILGVKNRTEAARLVREA